MRRPEEFGGGRGLDGIVAGQVADDYIGVDGDGFRH
jgi:hypothetical protein